MKQEIIDKLLEKFETIMLNRTKKEIIDAIVLLNYYRYIDLKETYKAIFDKIEKDLYNKVLN